MKSDSNRRFERQLNQKNMVTGHCQKLHYPIGKQKIFIAIIGKLVCWMIMHTGDVEKMGIGRNF